MKKKYNILMIAGAIGTILGIMWLIPSLINENIGISIAATLVLILGLILIAIGFGE